MRQQLAKKMNIYTNIIMAIHKLTKGLLVHILLPFILLTLLTQCKTTRLGTDKVGHNTYLSSHSLHKAAKEGKVTVVKGCLQRGAGINIQDSLGNTPLHLAAKNGHIDVIKLLLQHKADVNVQNDEGATPLHEASKNGYTISVNLLLQEGANVNIEDSMYKTALDYAVEKGDSTIVRALSRADTTKVYRKDRNGRTRLHYAAENGHIAAVNILLLHDSPVSIQDNDGNTPLHLALQNERFEAAKTLLENGADVFTTNKFGYTPLHIAASKQEKDALAIVKVLLQKINNVNTLTDRGCFTPLHLAARLGHLQVVKLLLVYGADVNAVTYGYVYDNNLTPLHEAAENGHAAVASLLLQHGANINAKTALGATALYMATYRYHTNLVQVLLEDASIDVNLTNNRGDTPLDIATNQEIAALLRSKGARSSLTCTIL